MARHTALNPRPTSGSDKRRPLVRPVAALLIALLMSSIALPGCGGCWNNNTSADAKKKEDEEKEKELRRKKLEKPKDDFEPLVVRMLPSNDPSPNRKVAEPTVKPGHWVAVQQTAKANNFDFPGELATFAEQPATNQPLEVEPYATSRVWSWCPAVLPKGQTKRIESLFYVPRRAGGLGKVHSIRSELHGTRGGRMEGFASIVSPSLKDYEHLIVVLAANSVTPAAYSHFDRLLSVKMPDVPAGENESVRYYYVLRPAVERNVPLPSYPLAWTTIAYVFWDDLDPSLLTNLQQQAMVDWLHWGGQLIISGPSSLDKLKGSFLAPYLPGEATETVKLEEEAFGELNATFSLPRTLASLGSTKVQQNHLRQIRIVPDRPMVGIELNKHALAKDIEGTGGLVVERRIGNGRIAVTRFPLTDVRIKQWKNFDGFFNAVLLRRPGREFGKDMYEYLKVNWAPEALKHMLLEARLGSTLRYFSRDIGYMPTTEPTAQTADQVQRPTLNSAKPTRPQGGMSGAPVYGAPRIGMTPRGMPNEEERFYRVETFTVEPSDDDWRFCGYHSSSDTGVAGWNDRGAASEAAREALAEAAGIQIPSGDFVVRVLAVYLLVLVPLNWLVFWIMGRVEWAWVAAPIIAVVGAGAIIRLAQLDIGFARSRTEIAVLEVQGGYERAHLTRYTALYTSLSSSYTLSFDEASSLALPFETGASRSVLSDSPLSLPDYTDVHFRRDRETSLAGVQVSSNSTGMVHSEQMLPLGKNPKVTESIVLVGDDEKGYTIRNLTDITLRDVGVFRRLTDTSTSAARPVVRIEGTYVAKIDPATSAAVSFTALRMQEPDNNDVDLETGRPLGLSYPAVWLPEWSKTQAFALSESSLLDGDRGRIRLTSLARLAVQQLRLLPGDVRLVAWTDEGLPGMGIQPEAPQNRMYTLVLAHLARGPLPPVKPDSNVAEDYVELTDPDTEPMPEANGAGASP